MINRVVTNMNCELHPHMMMIVVVDNNGEVHTHRHCSEGEMIANLADVVDVLRNEVLAEAARADLP